MSDAPDGVGLLQKLNNFILSTYSSAILEINARVNANGYATEKRHKNPN
jgi:hypothetical protein